jgi:hypothetical protein
MSFQFGGSYCSLCKSPGTNKSTCPLNRNALHPNPAAHPNAAFAFGREPPAFGREPPAFGREPPIRIVPPVKPIRPRSPPKVSPRSPPKVSPRSPPKVSPRSPPKVSPPSPKVLPMEPVNMMDLPDELLLKIMDHTNLLSYSKLSQVNSRLNNISKTKRLRDKWQLHIIAEKFRQRLLRYNIFWRQITNAKLLEIIHHLNGYESYDTKDISIVNDLGTIKLTKKIGENVYMFYRLNNKEQWLLNGREYRLWHKS